MSAAGTWRNACVTRAQTIADGTRMIDLAIEGPTPKIVPGCRADCVVTVGATSAIRSFPCIPAPQGRIRLVVDGADGDGRRFMWSLIEGATLHLRIAEDHEISAGGPSHPAMVANTAMPAGRRARDEAEPGAQPVAANSSMI